MKRNLQIGFIFLHCQISVFCMQRCRTFKAGFPVVRILSFKPWCLLESSRTNDYLRARVVLWDQVHSSNWNPALTLK